MASKARAIVTATSTATPTSAGRAARFVEPWRFSRDAPDFAQRFTGTFSDGGNTIACRGQLSRDGASWEDDLALTYRKTRLDRPCRPRRGDHGQSGAG